MIYKSGFTSINGKNYDISIQTIGSTAEQNFTLGGTPFTTSMKGDDDTIYKPCKYSSGTLNLITNDYMFDIYTSKAQGTKVTLKEENGDVVWIGYVEPNLYDMGFDLEREEIEISCIDGLSTLQYLKYKAPTREIKSLLDIIRGILKACNCYKKFYWSKATITAEKNEILPYYYISEQNFFDEKDDDETDDDVAWTMQDVLEEICKYFNVTCFADGENVFFVDYDAMKMKNNEYYEYNINDTDNGSTATKSFSKKIEAQHYSENGNNLSLVNVYTKVSVKDDFYTFDDVIPDMFKGTTNITVDDDNIKTTNIFGLEGYYGEFINNDLLAFVDRTYDPTDKNYNAKSFVAVRYLYNPKVGTTITSNANYTNTKNTTGSILAQFQVNNLKHRDKLSEIIGGTSPSLDKMLEMDDITTINTSNYICLFNKSNTENQPILTINANEGTCLYGGDNCYLIIKFKYYYHNLNEDPYPIPDGKIDISEGRYSMKENGCYLPCKLKIGNQYWNGSEWTTTESTFKIYYFQNKTDEERRADATMFKELDISSNINWRIGTKEKGYCIPIPKITSGMPQLTILSPNTPDYVSTSSGGNKGKWYKHSVVFLKDFTMKAIVGDPTYSDKNKTDTVYTTVIDENNTQDLSEIKFKVCTNDGKNPNYSSIAYKTNTNTYEWLKNTIALGETCTQEEHLIKRIYKQYSTPTVKLTLNLRNDNKLYGVYTDTALTNKKFIVDSCDTDYKYNKQTLTLIEKK